MKKKILKNKLLVRLAVLLVILVVGFLVLRNIDLKASFTILLQTPLRFILLFLLLSTLVQIFKAIAYSFLLKTAGVVLPIRRVLRAFIASQATSFLPAGETARVMLTEMEAKNKNQKITSGVLTQIFVELTSTIFVALVGSFYFQVFRIPAVFSLVILILLLFLILSETVWARFLKLLFLVKFLRKYEKSLVTIQKLISSQVFFPATVKIRPTFFVVMLFVFMSHVIGGLFIYTISTAYGLNLNPLNSIFVFAASLVIQGLLSITPGGVGFTEGGVIGLLVYFGNSFDKALALTIAFRVTGFLFNILFGLFIYLVYYRPGLKVSPVKEARGQL